MINQFKMDFYRFKTNKTMFALLFIFCAFQIFGIFMFKQYEQDMIEASGMKASMMNASEFIQSVLSQTPSWIMAYIAVFTVYFYISEHNSGFYKNMINMKKSRVFSVVSKILIQALFTLLMFIVLLIADFTGRGLFFDNTSIGDVGYFIKLLLGQFFLHWAFSILILCIAMLTRSMLASLIISFIFVLNIFGMLLGAIESLIDQIYVSKYLLVNTIITPLDFNSNGDLLHVILVSIFSILLFSGIAVSYKWKEDMH